MNDETGRVQSGGWDYRVAVREVTGVHIYDIREVYYDADGRIVRWSAEPVTPYGEDDASELSEDLQNMLDAFRRGVLRYDDLPGAHPMSAGRVLPPNEQHEWQAKAIAAGWTPPWHESDEGAEGRTPSPSLLFEWCECPECGHSKVHDNTTSPEVIDAAQRVLRYGAAAHRTDFRVVAEHILGPVEEADRG